MSKQYKVDQKFISAMKGLLDAMPGPGDEIWDLTLEAELISEAIKRAVTHMHRAEKANDINTNNYRIFLGS